MNEFTKTIKKFLSSVSVTFCSKILYFYNFHKRLNLKNPINFNEKLQFLKLNTYYDNPIITQCVDKFLVREFLNDRGFSDIMPNLIGGGYSSVESLIKEWNNFPEKFVIKCNHGCNYNIIVDDKAHVNLNDLIHTLKKWLSEDYWKIYCETQYRFVPKRIIVEEHLGSNIFTYKFYCFNGIPKFSYVSSNGLNGEKDLYLDFFDINWNHLDITLDGHLHFPGKITKPDNYDSMLEIAEKISSEFPFVRVDLYNVNGKIYFSELTFIPTGGLLKIVPNSILDDWGKFLDLNGVLS